MLLGIVATAHDSGHTAAATSHTHDVCLCACRHPEDPLIFASVFGAALMSCMRGEGNKGEGAEDRGQGGKRRCSVAVAGICHGAADFLDIRCRLLQGPV
jgi:hypothetical protein